jgi:hypothetical protein
VSPYWRAVPWPQLLTNYLALAVYDTPPDWLATDPEHPTAADVLTGLPVPDLQEWAECSCTRFCGVEVNREHPPWPWNANAANAWWICKISWEQAGFKPAEHS